VRRTLLNQLAENIKAHNDTNPAPTKERKVGFQDIKGKSFITYLTASAMNRESQLEFVVNKLQPYLYFPIGLEQDSSGTLRGLYDTGGCCNMGWLQYHQQIAKKFPEIVHRFIAIQKRATREFHLADWPCRRFSCEHLIRAPIHQQSPTRPPPSSFGSHIHNITIRI